MTDLKMMGKRPAGDTEGRIRKKNPENQAGESRETHIDRVVSGDEGDRTPGLGIANAALSRLSYIPTISICFGM